MKLKELLKDVCVLSKQNYNDNLEVEAITDNSKKACKNSLFFALIGTNTNGSVFIYEATKNGAKVVVLQEDDLLKKAVFEQKKLKKNNKVILGNKNSSNLSKTSNVQKTADICYIFVDDIRKQMSKISANFYYNAHQNLKIISVVGTNGKTSTSHILYSILRQAKKSVGVIGTNSIIINDEKRSFDMTTPDPIFLHQLFFEMAQKNVEYVVIEVSAHAIFFHKMYGVKSICTIFTNFSQDHLDFFDSMEKYKNTKISFFNSKNTNVSILNMDDDVSMEISRQTDTPILTFGIKKPSDVFAVNISMNLSGSEFVVNYQDEVFSIKTNLTCLFNVYNILGAIACSKVLNIKTIDIKKALSNLDKIAGRFDIVDLKQNFNIVVDYAHTPDSLKSLLENIKSLSKSKIITVFGCPGNRDELKREIMGKIAGKYSEYCIITSDNPQFENSIKILRQIESGVKKTNCPYKLVDNRKNAISLAISIAPPKSTVLIVGKGTENYQNINGEHIPYSDYDEIKSQILLAKKLKLNSKFLY